MALGDMVMVGGAAERIATAQYNPAATLGASGLARMWNMSLLPQAGITCPGPSWSGLGYRDCPAVDRGRRRLPRTTASGSALAIHGVAPSLTSASCVQHRTIVTGLLSWVIAQAIAPSSVHGVCQVVFVKMSGQMTLRPAPHMPVNSRHLSQKPSLAGIGSRIGKPQVGHAFTA